MFDLAYEQTIDVTGRNFILKLYNNYGRLMYFIVNKYCSDPFAQEDIVQDTLLKLIEKNTRLRELEEKALAAYISMSVRNTAYSYLRKRAKEREMFISLDEALSYPSLETAPVEETITMLEIQGNLAQVWQELSAEDRFLLEGRYILQYTDRELSESLGCKPGSVRMKLTRVRRKVLKGLKKWARKGDGNA